MFHANFQIDNEMPMCSSSITYLLIVCLLSASHEKNVICRNSFDNIQEWMIGIEKSGFVV